MRLGSVALVGAGPGPAEFLTLAAAKALAEAEVILYDALIGADVRALFPSSAKVIYVGKRCGKHALRQDQINEILLQHAADGYRVVRLKGGDPLIFGRAAEELDALRSASIPVRIIPGISAVNGLAAVYALPLTDRAQSQELRIIQGHHLDPRPQYWHELAHYEGTLVIYMGLEQLTIIVERLRNFGAPAGRPLAIIETSSEGFELRDNGGGTHLTRSSLGAIQSGGFIRKTQGPGIIYIGSNVSSMQLEPYSSQEAPYAPAIAHFS